MNAKCINWNIQPQIKASWLLGWKQSTAVFIFYLGYYRVSADMWSRAVIKTEVEPAPGDMDAAKQVTGRKWGTWCPSGKDRAVDSSHLFMKSTVPPSVHTWYQSYFSKPGWHQWGKPVHRNCSVFCVCLVSQDKLAPTMQPTVKY